MIPLIKTHFSVGKSIIQVEDFEEWTETDPDNLAALAVEYGIKKVFLVEDRMSSLIPAYKTLKAQGIGLVFGLRLNFVSDVTQPGLEGVHKNIIFAKNEAGYKKLIEINNRAAVDFFDKEPRMDYHNLHKMWTNDLELAVPFYDSFIHNNLLTMQQSVPDFRGLKPVFFLEDNQLPFDQVIRAGVMNYGAETVEAKSIFYRSRRDHIAWLARKLMERASYGSGTIEKPNLEGCGSMEFCMEAWAEKEYKESKFEASFQPLELSLPGIRLPEVEISQERRKKYGITPEMDSSAILAQICRTGFKEKKEKGILAVGRDKDYGARMKHELDVLHRTHFTDYILLVWDFMELVNDRKLPRGLARGSAGGGLVNYLTGITDIDPIEHDLLFERFISEARAKTNTIDGVNYLGNAPDIDVDLGRDARKQVIEYVESRHEKRFCKLSTCNTLATKSLVKEVLKIMLLFKEDEAKEISGVVEERFGKMDSPQKTFEKNKKFQAFFSAHPREWQIVQKLIGCIKSVGVHPSAYLVSYYPLDEIMPLEVDKDGVMCAAYDMYTAESLVIKIDLLGLDTVDLIDSVFKMTGDSFRSIDYNSSEIYDPLQMLKTGFGLFQISGDAAMRGLQKIQPKNIDQLADVLAICRPGAFSFIDQYADYMHGRIEKPEMHPIFNDILDKTAGLCLYQESLMQMAVKLGFSLVEADTLRRIVGKKKKSEIEPWEEKVRVKCEENHLDQEAGKVFFDVANASADYSFNKSLHGSTMVFIENGDFVEANSIKIGDKILAYNTVSKEDHFVEVIDIDHHDARLYEFLLLSENGQYTQICCSLEHKCLCTDGAMRPMQEIIEENHSIIGQYKEIFKVDSYDFVGEMDSLDFEVDHPDHNFYADGIVVSNSHSQAYAILTAISVYCKFKYPKEFFLSALNLYSGDQDKIAQIAQELPLFGLRLLPPDIAKSGIDFEMEGNAIRFGIGSIKGISTAAISGLRSFSGGGFINLFSIFNAAKQNKLNQTVMIGLICSGCLDAYSDSRPTTVMHYQIFNKLTERERNYLIDHGEEYNYNVITALRSYLEWVGPNGKKMGTEKRLETIRRDTKGYVDLFNENSKSPDVTEYLYEKALLGFSYSHTLSSLFKKFDDLSDANRINNVLMKDDKFEFVGEVVEAKMAASKKDNTKYAKLVLRDESGTVSMMFYGYKWEKYLGQNLPPPEEEQLVYVQGTKGDDICWIDRMSIQHLDAFMRVSELRKHQNKMLKAAESGIVDIDEVKDA